MGAAQRLVFGLFLEQGSYNVSAHKKLTSTDINIAVGGEAKSVICELLLW